MKIVCIGDSHTYGFGVGRGDVWTKVAQDLINEEIINKGISGDTSGGMVGRLYADVITHKPRVVHIMGGTNDFITDSDVGVVQSNIMAMVHQCVYHNIIPIIGLPIKIDVNNIRQDWKSFTDFNEVENKLTTYKKWLINFCTTFNVDYIDYDKFFCEKIGDDFSNLFFDGLHFTKEGNMYFGEIFAENIKKLFIN